jgi:hypothetical protein
MKKFVFAILTTGALFTASAAKLNGTISDAKCGKAHADASEKSQACVKKCVGGGQAAVFVSGDKIYTFDAKSIDKIKEHLGHKVEINGNLKGDVLTVESVKMAPGS